MNSHLFSPSGNDGIAGAHLFRSILSIVGLGLAAVAPAETLTFESAPPGANPPGWMATATGRGEAKWSVEADSTAPTGRVLKQSGEADFPVCLRAGTKLKDGFVAVRFKPVSGKEDQAGGLVWRAGDPNNYYVVRANALEDNVTVYTTVAGQRIEKKRANARVAAGEWHTLRVDFTANHFNVTFDGKPVLEWSDDTFANAGMVGVWTKADSVTVFDDFSYSDPPAAAHAQNPTDMMTAVQATSAKDCGCGECASSGCKPCHGKNCYYCVAKGLVTTECGCGSCTPGGCATCGPGCDVCKFNLAPVAAAKAKSAP